MGYIGINFGENDKYFNKTDLLDLSILFRVIVPEFYF